MGRTFVSGAIALAAFVALVVPSGVGRAQTTAELVEETQDALLSLGDFYLQAESAPSKIEAAIAAYEKAAAIGSTTALMRLGALYRDGGPVAADAAQAFGYFQQAAEAGEPYAKLRVGEMTARGVGVAQDVELGRRIVQELADVGNGDARVTLGDLYSRGDAGPIDVEAALAAYEHAAAAGNVTALMRLGNLYRDGRIVAADAAKSVDYFGHAAAAGEPYAKLRVGEMTARGIGVAQDANLGRRLVREVAESGNQDALVTLGDLYSRGDAGPVDGGEAVAAYEQAAAMGNVTALIRLGSLYRDGSVVPADGARAIAYLQRAAEAGSEYALLALGQGYTRGQFAGVDSPEEGLHFLVEADHLGVPEAALALSEVYLDGRGVPQDPVRGLEILEQAAKQGNAWATRRLVSFYRDGSGPQARRDLRHARAILREHADHLEPESLSYETILLDAASAFSVASYQAVYKQTDTLTPAVRRSAIRAFRRINPNVYVFALQSRLSELGAYSGAKSGVLNAPVARALARYCRLNGSPELCRRGPLSASAADVLLQAF